MFILIALAGGLAAGALLIGARILGERAVKRELNPPAPEVLIEGPSLPQVI